MLSLPRVDEISELLEFSVCKIFPNFSRLLCIHQKINEIYNCLMFGYKLSFGIKACFIGSVTDPNMMIMNDNVPSFPNRKPNIHFYSSTEARV